MGVYLNPGRQSFQMDVNSDIFVDKTEMIRYLNSVVNTGRRYVSVSRPRRFGKTMAANMICAYYDREAESRELFKDLKIASGKDTQQPWDRYLGKFDVLRIVMTDFLEDSENITEVISYLTEEVTTELMEAYPDIRYGSRIKLRTVMSKIYAKTHRPFVIVIDEWDAVFRIRKEDGDGQIKYLDFLREWLKDKDYIALAYMTGILPIKKYGEHSALNMFDEYSMIEPMQFAAFTGFTEQEVAALCNKYQMSYTEVADWYDGYLVSDRIPVDKRILYREGEYKEHIFSIYSPLSVVSAMRNGVIRNYWNSTESYEALAEYIRRDYFGLKSTVALLMDGGRVKVDLSTYQNDMTTFHNKDDILALLIHLGYLGYDTDAGEVFIPNKEILDVFKASTKSKEWTGTFRSFELSQKILQATWSMDEDRVAELLEKAHDYAANRTYNDEAALSYSIQLAYYAAEKYYTKALELDSGKGYADIVYIPSPRYPDKPVLLIELKYEKNTETAADQIHRRNYPQRLEHYKGNILLVSVNYDKEAGSSSEKFKHHSCKIEKV